MSHVPAKWLAVCFQRLYLYHLGLSYYYHWPQCINQYKCLAKGPSTIVGGLESFDFTLGKGSGVNLSTAQVVDAACTPAFIAERYFSQMQTATWDLTTGTPPYWLSLSTSCI